ncbi:hypothetical protein [Salegentibacter sp. Hel_I_6]|uniref:hypothetical protein n=1 Tax=Salegentibacter sp. Hel_I_6 TaxID=1250278 RepID=UPI00056283B8|nr:hypothetical protein [Salegentibacter sp. Hel_I_6]
MRLVYLQNIDDAYVAKAEISVKAFGLSVRRKTKIFTRKTSENIWREEKSNKIASKRETAFLNKWLKDHQKFIEH